jgi:hypothetical protein
MKLVMSTTVAAVVLTLLATGLAEAQKNDCVKVRWGCRAEVWGGMNSTDYGQLNLIPEGTYAKISECIRARGCVPHFPPRPSDWDWSKRSAFHR